jgi:hypothetical protein
LHQFVAKALLEIARFDVVIEVNHLLVEPGGGVSKRRPEPKQWA